MSSGRLARIRFQQPAEEFLALDVASRFLGIIGFRWLVGGLGLELYRNSVADALMGSVLVEEGAVFIEDMLQMVQAEEDQMIETLDP